MFGCVFAAAFVSYVQRQSLSVVAAQLMPEVGITKVELGWLYAAFLGGYTLFQFPGGLIAQRFGARHATFTCVLLSTLATAATAFAPRIATGIALVAMLVVVRAVNGLALGPLFPANAGVVQAWFPPHRWALMNGLQVTGLSLGATVTPPLVAAIMRAYGWHAALYATCLPGLALAAVWLWYVRNTPREHGAVPPAELAEIEPTRRVTTPRRVSWAEVRLVLANRNVLLLSLSYLLMNYVFYFFMNWSFLYLVQERQLTLLEGGWLASVPFLTGSICASVGGYLCDFACRRFGARWGFRLLPLITLPLAAALLLIAVRVQHPYAAVVALAACFGCAQMTEAPFWAATFWVARERASAATGVLNTGGNLGGIIGSLIVGYLSAAQHWQAVFATGVGFALAGAALWLLIDAETGVLVDP